LIDCTVYVMFISSERRGSLSIALAQVYVEQCEPMDNIELI